MKTRITDNTQLEATLVLATKRRLSFQSCSPYMIYMELRVLNCDWYQNRVQWELHLTPAVYCILTHSSGLILAPNIVHVGRIRTTRN